MQVLFEKVGIQPGVFAFIVHFLWAGNRITMKLLLCHSLVLSQFYAADPYSSKIPTRIISKSSVRSFVICKKKLIRFSGKTITVYLPFVPKLYGWLYCHINAELCPEHFNQLCTHTFNKNMPYEI